MGQSIIELRGVNKDYFNEGVVTPVLHEISFVIKSGEFVSIMGPSGCGKSTLLHILGLLDTATSGQYLLDGQDVSQITNDEELAKVRGQRIGFVFQSFNLLPRTTVLDNVLLPLMYSGVPYHERLSRAKKAIQSVGLEHRLQYLSGQLSGGEKQRVAIARSLVNNPTVILADEPTGNLDSKSGLQVMEILQGLNNSGKTIVLVTHETMTAEFAQRVIKLHDGVVVSDQQIANRRQVLDGESFK